MSLDKYSQLGIGQVFNEHAMDINAVDFSLSGERFVTSSDDKSLALYDALKGELIKKVNFKSTGVSNAQWISSDPWTVLCSSANSSGDIFVHSLYDNHIIKCFQGHHDTIYDLKRCPESDTFASSSKDNSVHLWDLKSGQCTAVLKTPSPALLAFDPEGLVFATATRGSLVKLFDARSTSKAFAAFKVELHSLYDGKEESNASSSDAVWSSIQFSPSGEHILLGTNYSKCVLLDSFEGYQIREFHQYSNKFHDPLQATFTPDGKSFAIGTDNRKIHFVDLDMDNLTFSSKKKSYPATCKSTLEVDHPGPIRMIRFNPRYQQFVSSCSSSALWISQT